MKDKKTKILIGAHMPISGGLYKAIEYGEKIGCTAIQMFVKNSKSWYAKKLTPNQINLFQETLKKSTIEIVVAHSSYLINIGSPNSDIEKKSVSSLITELEICEKLNIPHLIIHPGSHLGSGEKECIQKISNNLDLILQRVDGKTMILLETTAGQGTNIGYTFEQLKQIRAECKEKNKIGVCVDTCHIFTAGYDISTKKGYEKVLDEFDKTLGLKLLKVIHLNNSKAKLGSKLDRHANIKNGLIPLKIFKLIMNDKRFVGVPKILETPHKKKNIFEEEIKFLKGLVKMDLISPFKENKTKPKK